MIGLVGSERVMLEAAIILRHGDDGLRFPRALRSKIADADKDAILNGNAEKMLSGKRQNVQASSMTGRVPTAAVTGFIVDAMQKPGVPAS